MTLAIKEEMSKEKRIFEEKKKLKNIFKDFENDKKILINGLIERAAYMLVTLEDYEKDIDENGYIELFSQSDKLEPYERERPVIRLYNTMNKNYLSIIRQLRDLLPKDETEKTDELLEFISGNTIQKRA